MFHRATVVCPSCQQRFRDAKDSCERCGFDAYRTVQQFPYTPPVLEAIVDSANCLNEEDKNAILTAQTRLARRFPQVLIPICTVEMDDPVKLPELGFWMMNACKLSEGQSEETRAWSILLLIDVKRGLVSITPGYAIEAFIEDSGWENALRDLSESLLNSAYRKAILSFLKHADRLLFAASKNVRKRVSS